MPTLYLQFCFVFLYSGRDELQSNDTKDPNRNAKQASLSSRITVVWCYLFISSDKFLTFIDINQEERRLSENIGSRDDRHSFDYTKETSCIANPSNKKRHQKVLKNIQMDDNEPFTTIWHTFAQLLYCLMKL